jgi:hypothetical protein
MRRPANGVLVSENRAFFPVASFFQPSHRANLTIALERDESSDHFFVMRNDGKTEFLDEPDVKVGATCRSRGR